MKEPSVLDYLKSLTRKDRINLKNYFQSAENGQVELNKIEKKQTPRILRKSPIVLSIFFASVAQTILEFSKSGELIALFLYIVSGITLWKNWNISHLEDPEFPEEKPEPTIMVIEKPVFLYLSIPLLIGAFIFFKNGYFNFLNITLWIGGIVLFVLSFWKRKQNRSDEKKLTKKILVLLIIAMGISGILRFYKLNSVPNEMFSDHAEKLLDIMDILNGSYPIYFPRNTGREPLQFYLTAVLIRLFNMEIGFISLKIGTALAGFITLAYIFLLGQYLFNDWVGLLALFFAGIAYWPNVISRIGLRFPFYPLFTAPSIYYLIKGLDLKKTNDLLMSGLFLGIGLFGYSPFRVVPILVSVIISLYYLKNKSVSMKNFALNAFFLIAITAFIVFLPLFRYSLEHPAIVSYRSLSRISGIERPIEVPVVVVFFRNLWNAVKMFFHENGVVWVNSIPNRPALDIISAIFYFLGSVILSREWVARKNWKKFSLLISTPILMMPSILSLAYPGENPALNRSAGAIIPVFIIVGYGFFSLTKNLYDQKAKLIKGIGVGSTVVILALSFFQNYDLVFNQFASQFSNKAWNSSEIGGVISKFVALGNKPENAFVIPFPHWVDTRLVGINAGFPEKDYAIWPEKLLSTLDMNGSKLFILKPEDYENMDALELLYPEGNREIFYSKTPGKNFIMFMVLDN